MEIKLNITPRSLLIEAVIGHDSFNPELPNERHIMQIAGVVAGLGYAPNNWSSRSGGTTGKVVFYYLR